MSMTSVRNIVRLLIKTQIYLSRRFDSRLSEKFRTDGMRDFMDSFVPRYLEAHLRVYDVGGGKNPAIDLPTKAGLGITLVGLDIDEDELSQAAHGVYDETICADITEYEGRQDADLVVCKAVLEHVVSVERALASISSILKIGGRAIIFVPSRNAVYSRLNLILPQDLKVKLLSLFNPDGVGAEGFPAYYDRCTPKDFSTIASCYGMEVIESRLYFSSGYFSYFFPAHLLWRVWLLCFYWLRREQAAESFSMAFEKRRRQGEACASHSASASEGTRAVRSGGLQPFIGLSARHWCSR